MIHLFGICSTKEEENFSIIVRRYISARRKTGNNKSILLTKKIILQIARELPSEEIPITEKPVNRFASQTMWLASKPCEQLLKEFVGAIKLTLKWDCNNILVIVKIIYNLK